MAQRFTKSELFQLRNEIKIQFIIEELLKIPTKEHEGMTRFLCPRCGEFQTGINPNTNLARCFRCEENFNPIDLVMAVRNIPFVETAKLLSKVLGAGQKARTVSSPPTGIPERSGSEPEQIGELLATMAAAADLSRQSK